MNLTAIMYVAFRLSPVILVSYFILSSILNSDIRGLIFLGLMLIEVLIVLTIGNAIGSGMSDNPNGVCNALTLTTNGPLSKYFPLSLNVVSFTFGYLASVIEQHKLIDTNIPTVVLFSVFTLYHCFWLFMNSCANPKQILGSLLLGFGFGWFFSSIIGRQKGLVELQYFNAIKNTEVCSRQNKQSFKCSSRMLM